MTLCPRSWGAHDKICSSLVKQKVKISVLGLIDAMSVLPVANFISVYAAQRNGRARLVKGLNCFLCRTLMWCATEETCAVPGNE